MTISGQEQLMIELVNRARLDPNGEALLLGFEDRISAMDLPAGSMAPLAGNILLKDAADDHSDWMLATDTFSHTGENGSSAGERMEQAGYDFFGSYTWGENIGYRGSSGSIDPTSATYNLHSALFDSDGHRKNMLNPNFTEIGIGHQVGDYKGYDTVMVTQNFASRGGQTFLTGVAYDDTDGDDFYSVGEGVQGVRFTVDGKSNTSAQAGGYSVQFQGAGWHDVSLSGAGVSIKVRVNFTGDNVKLDLVDKNTVQSSASLTLSSGVSNAVLLGLNDLNLTGSGGSNRLTGNKGDNAVWGLSGNDVIDGLGGDDTLTGGAGNDTIRGGDGTDTAVLNVDASSVQVSQTNGGVIITSSEGTDTFSGVEFFQFNDERVSLANVLNGSFSSEGEKPADSMTLIGSSANEVLRGDTGTDNIEGMDGFDTIFAGQGDDSIDGGEHADELYGGGGNDWIEGGAGFDKLYGESGNDTLFGGDSADRLYGGSEDDVLYGGSNHGSSIDGLFGGSGDDTLYGQSGFDHLEGGIGNDLLDGGAQADNLFGGDGNDTMRGGDGLDRLFGGNGDDFGRGGAGDDGLFGGTGSDTLNGEAGNDRFFGGSGNDDLDGELGQDTLFGGAGFDTLKGGLGDDVLQGDFNADTFVFRDGDGNDTIVDFDATNQFEKIDLSEVSAITSMSDLQNNHLSQVGANVIIDTGSGNSVTLIGVDLSDLDSNDFIF